MIPSTLMDQGSRTAKSKTSPEHRLHPALAGLRHLNLEGRITFDDPDHHYASGGYGEVYTGILQLTAGDQVKVAIKRLRFALKEKDFIAKLVARELYIWSKSKHINILPLRGFIIDEIGLPSLISEWMDNGSALEYVKKHSECDVMHLILGIANGLAYLHNEGVVHADMKSDNVLVSSSGDAKICDFGISRAIDATQATLGGNTTRPGGPVGSIRWMAYELIAESEIYTKHTKESDVWAFGMTVYELLTKEVPYARIVDISQVIVSVIRGKLPSPNSFDDLPQWKQDVYRMCESCWTQDPANRITMADAVEVLTNQVLPLKMDDSDLQPTPHAVSEITLAAPQDPVELLHQTLAHLNYLNLDGSVTFDNPHQYYSTGGYAEIYIGTRDLPDRRQVKVAIKRLRFSLRDKDLIAEYTVKELYIWSKLDHHNILQLWGFINDENDYPSLISEWMENGSVLQYVKKNPDCDVMRLIIGTAEGLAYLHENDVVHSSIQSDNILVSASGDAKIIDFGFSHAMEATQVALGRNPTRLGGQTGSVRWTAYELLVDHETEAKHTKESDVWAFGMTVYEMLTEQLPYAHISVDVEVTMSVMRGDFPSLPLFAETWSSEKREVWKLCQSCWELDPKTRITMDGVVKALKVLSPHN
ncbi:hypothetical protein EW145_g1994 [Phellinidium pouzarii]|uniref:Protein kinase domain-containing protein n=1 Tax=Phellinidium pouzarii TaxID=167371 RepID=A0A4S4LD04_9AGAM|nr:hypothetical protein EW145_g1994 [Phellinidium pouzarii]